VDVDDASRERLTRSGLSGKRCETMLPWPTMATESDPAQTVRRPNSSVEEG
jgi:hypothetical protein